MRISKFRFFTEDNYKAILKKWLKSGNKKQRTISQQTHVVKLYWKTIFLFIFFLLFLSKGFVIDSFLLGATYNLGQVFTFILYLSLCEKCPYPEFFQSVFSRIWTEFGEILYIRTRKTSNTDTFHAV